MSLFLVSISIISAKTFRFFVETDVNRQSYSIGYDCTVHICSISCCNPPDNFSYMCTLYFIHYILLQEHSGFKNKLDLGIGEEDLSSLCTL